MTNEKILEVIAGYELLLDGHEPLRDNAAQTLTARMMHLHWMCRQVRNFLVEDRRDKAFRWLGFIQGAFWVMGLRTVEEMKNDNRPAGNEGQAEPFDKDH